VGPVSDAPADSPRHATACRTWRIGRSREIFLDRPRLMAVLNITPDSFSDGGSYPTVREAVEAARRAVEAGADILDIGGESTRPGAPRVTAPEQIARVAPVIEEIRRDLSLQSVAITVDTTLSEVADAAFDAGADAVNDVSAGTEDEAMLGLIADRLAGVVLMHRLAAPAGDRYSDRYEPGDEPRYRDVVADVREHLAARVEAALARGVRPEGIVVDPGLGFGKTVGQNLELVRRTWEIADLGYPVLSGASRKSFVGRVSGMGDAPAAERVAGSVAFSVAHYMEGAIVFRVHDVAEHARALRAAHAIKTGVWGS
jgi:dihydropteroate synthase